MPELPEAETIVRGLRPHVTGRTVTGVDVGRIAPLNRFEMSAWASGRLNTYTSSILPFMRSVPAELPIFSVCPGFISSGVPVYVLYRPGREPLLLPEVLQRQTVLSALAPL